MKVSRSGFYAWLKPPESKRSIFWRQLLTEIKLVHEQTHQRYGAVKCWKALNRKGVICGRDQVAKLRRINNIYSKHRRRLVITTQSKRVYEAAPNRLKREFDIAAPNKAFVNIVVFIKVSIKVCVEILDKINAIV